LAVVAFLLLYALLDPPQWYAHWYLCSHWTWACK
jgi:hypothetical protein